ncbi:MAG: SUMF1/EgtB/PvdO family nonheme iron enzyme [Isosphaerales bacterium]
MSTHLCDEQIHRLLGGTLPDDELSQADAHLWQCPDCRDALRRRTEPMPDLPPLGAPRSEGAAPQSTLPTVPGYEILGELGRGGMAVVYQAQQLQPDRIVALKMIRAIEHAGPIERLRFQIETEAVARLQHTHIVQLYEAGEVGGQPFFSLEFCDGGTLAQQWKKQRPSPREAAGLIETLARAMHYAHLRGVIHRDLKPGNVLLAGPERVAKITDFGLAKRIDAEARDVSQSGAIMGTASYMAPEQAAGKVHDTGPATDVYGLGALLYECLTDQPPFYAETALETMQQVLEREPLPPSRRGVRVPRDLETICLKCLNKVPARRYASAEDLANDLRLFQAGEPIRARAVGAAERTWKWARRRPALAALLGVVLLAIVGLSALSVIALDREQKAQREADKARKARDFLVRIFRIKDIQAGNTTTARQILNEAEQRIPMEFAVQPELRDELLAAIEDVNRNLDRTIPAAMILESRGGVKLRSDRGDGARPVPQTLLYPDDRLALAADAHVQIVFMSNLHKERLEPGREATIGRTGCFPPAAVRERDDSVLMTFVRLPKGTFYMGWDGKPRSAKETEIREDFEIALHDVTQGQWEAIMGNNPSWFSRGNGGRNWVLEISDEELKLFPVENVSWDDARKFIKKLNEKEVGRGYLYRMPSEAEWEYACRAGATSEKECSYHFYFDKPTNDLSSAMANFNGNEPFGEAPSGPWLTRPTRVGAYPSNRLGLCDMHGNVWQWTDTASGSGRVDRGGSWRDNSRSCRAGERFQFPPTVQGMNLGFRLARVPVR